MRPLSNPFRLWDISSLFGLSTDEPVRLSTDNPFRLLHLPREIRDMIYSAILCDWGAQGTIQHGLTDDGKDIQLQVTAKKVDTNILLTSKLVYEEAKQVFLKGNQFVHIRMRARNPSLILGIFSRSKIAIVASGRDSVNRFKDLVVMKHTIEFPEDEGPFGRSLREFEIDIIIMKRDLWTFANWMAIVDVQSRHFAGDSKHELTIYNPFVKTPTPYFLNETNLENLLKPYLERFHGFEDVKVQGEIDPDFAKSVVAKINSEPPLPSPPNNILDKIITWKSHGDESFRKLEYSKAILYWTAAQISYMALRNRKAWPRLIETAGKDFTDRLSEMAFEVESSRARAYLDMTEADPDSGHDLSGTPIGWMSFSTTCVDAMEIGNTLGTGWTPSDDQAATIFYFLAKGHRLLDDDVHFAEDAIRRADELRPDDEEIGSEMEKIVEWKHSMGLP